MVKSEITKQLNECFEGFQKTDIPKNAVLTKGKVRDIIDCGKSMIISTSDRISAFDRILSLIPFKGEVLNQLALFWFNQTSDIIDNHIRKEISPRSIDGVKCKVLPVEVVVRGYLTGSAWRDYQAGKSVSGIILPDGLSLNNKLPNPIITPSTKAENGKHDEPISGKEITEKGLVEKTLWEQVENTALRLFERGTEIAAKRGLILVDTKYEFGILDGKLLLVDEVHTPDSSRYWYADTYKELFQAGKKQRKLDKEYLRQWLMERGFQGDGEPPKIPDTVRAEVANRYIKAYEEITGQEFSPKSKDIEAEKQTVVSYIEKNCV